MHFYSEAYRSNFEATVTDGAITIRKLDGHGAPSQPRTFRVGDTAIEGAYNMTYLGKITHIGPKTVTVVGGHKTRRFDHGRFAVGHWNFDLATVLGDNATTLQHI